MAETKDEVIRGEHEDGNRFIQRNIGGWKILVQSNRLGEWHGYLWVPNYFKHFIQFESEKHAESWIMGEHN